LADLNGRKEPNVFGRDLVEFELNPFVKPDRIVRRQRTLDDTVVIDLKHCDYSREGWSEDCCEENWNDEACCSLDRYKETASCDICKSDDPPIECCNEPDYFASNKSYCCNNSSDYIESCCFNYTKYKYGGAYFDQCCGDTPSYYGCDPCNQPNPPDSCCSNSDWFGRHTDQCCPLDPSNSLCICTFFPKITFSDDYASGDFHDYQMRRYTFTYSTYGLCSTQLKLKYRWKVGSYNSTGSYHGDYVIYPDYQYAKKGHGLAVSYTNVNSCSGDMAIVEICADGSEKSLVNKTNCPAGSTFWAYSTPSSGEGLRSKCDE